MGTPPHGARPSTMPLVGTGAGPACGRCGRWGDSGERAGRRVRVDRWRFTGAATPTRPAPPRTPPARQRLHQPTHHHVSDKQYAHTRAACAPETHRHQKARLGLAAAVAAACGCQGTRGNKGAGAVDQRHQRRRAPGPAAARVTVVCHRARGGTGTGGVRGTDVRAGHAGGKGRGRGREAKATNDLGWTGGKPQAVHVQARGRGGQAPLLHRHVATQRTQGRPPLSCRPGSRAGSSGGGGRAGQAPADRANSSGTRRAARGPGGGGGASRGARRRQAINRT